MSELLTIKEAARFAHVSYETVVYWIKTGRLATMPGPLSLRTGRPGGKRVSRANLLLASPSSKSKQMKSDNRHLMTITEIAKELGIGISTAYGFIKRYDLEKTYVDRWTYMIDGSQLADFMEDDATYSYLLKIKRHA
tara:strand:+ start:151 stop:561 length:411 start_codon:yes stop_codon:yes gene_type:complete